MIDVRFAAMREDGHVRRENRTYRAIALLITALKKHLRMLFGS